MESTDKRIIEKLDQVYNEALENAIETKFLEQFRIEGENDKDLIKRIPELCNKAINIAEDFFGCETIRITEGTFSCSFSSWRYFEIRKGFERDVRVQNESPSLKKIIKARKMFAKNTPPPAEPVEVAKEMYQEKSPEIVLVQYSDRAVAVFGETYKIKDILKEFGAKFNRYLRWEGSVKPGWIMSLKAADQVRNHLQIA